MVERPRRRPTPPRTRPRQSRVVEESVEEARKQPCRERGGRRGGWLVPFPSGAMRGGWVVPFSSGRAFAPSNDREKENPTPRPAPEGALCEKCPLIRPSKVVDPSGAGRGAAGRRWFVLCLSPTAALGLPSSALGCASRFPNDCPWDSQFRLAERVAISVLPLCLD